MKKLCIVLILFLLPIYSGRSQSVSYDNKTICFDSAAARKVLLNIYEAKELREENKLLNEALSIYDSIYFNQKSVIDNLKRQQNWKSDSISECQSRYSILVNQDAKKVRKYRWSIAGLIVVTILTAIIK